MAELRSGRERQRDRGRAAGPDDARRAADAAWAAFPAWLDEFTELRWITVGGPGGRHYPI